MQDFTPRIDAGVTDPAALEYARKAQQRVAANRGNFVGGIPLPSIPAFDPAAMNRPPGTTPAPSGGIFGPPQGSSSELTSLTPMDQLMPKSRQDPDFRDMGSMLAVAQPNMAMKYGVMRNGAYIPPNQITPMPMQAPQTNRTSADTQRDFQAAMQMPVQAVQGATAQAPSPKQSAPRTEEVLKNMDDLSYGKLKKDIEQDSINCPEQRTAIESRLSPLDISELIINGFITQRVPIKPGVYEPTFRSISAEEDLAVKRLISEEANTVSNLSDQYLVDKYAFMQLACGVHAINGNPFPSHTDTQGNFDTKNFWVKFNKIIKLPLPIIRSLGVNYLWFDQRVRAMCTGDAIKNG